MISGMMLPAKRSMMAALTVALICCFVVSGSAFSAEEKAQEPVRTQVFRLNYIKADTAKSFLNKLGFGKTINTIKGVNAIVVSASGDELFKAKSVVDLVDSKQEFIVRFFKSTDYALTVEKVSEKLRKDNVKVGTFNNPPLSKNGAKVILDQMNNNIVAIAPTVLISKVEGTIQSCGDVPAKKCAKTTSPKTGTVKTPAAKTAQPKPSAKPADQTPKGQTSVTSTIKITKTTPEQLAEKIKSAPAEKKGGEDQLLEALEKLGQKDAKPQAVKKAAEIAEAEAKPQTTVPAAPTPAKPEPQQAAPKKAEKKAAPTPEQVPQELLDVIKQLDPEMAKQMAKEKAPAEPQKPSNDVPLKKAAEPTDGNSRMAYTEKLDIPEAEKELELTITLPEKVEITALLELVGKQLGLNYIYDANKVKGDVMLKVHDGKIKVRDTYALLESVLSFRDLVMTRRGNLVTIVPKAEAAKIDPALTAAGDKVRPGDVIITNVFKLEHISTDAAKQVLNSMQLGENMIELPETKTLVVTGYAYKMGRIEKLLEIVDVPGEKKDFRHRQLEYTTASVLVDKVKSLAEQMGTVKISVSSTAAATKGKPQPVRRDSRGRVISRRTTPQAKSTSIGSAPEEGVYLDVDERTNRILMIGSKEDLDIVDSLIDTFDVPQKDLRFVRQYQIEYVDAEDIQSKLSELGIISGGGITKPSSVRSPASKAARARSAANSSAANGTDQEPGVEEPIVIVIETSNSLLVKATPEQHSQITEIIAFIDARPREDSMPVKLYSLENQDPVAMVETLEKLISEVVESGEGKIEKKIKKEDDITLVADENTFSIIVYASKKNQEWVGALIKDLDKRRPQVLLDATLVAITKNDSFNYDLQFAGKTPNMDKGGFMDVVGQITNADTPANGFVGNTREYYSSPINGTAQAFYSSSHIEALLTAMQKKSYGRVLAQPRILVNDNEEGVIKTERTTYIARKSTTTQGTGDSPVVSENVNFDEFVSGIDLTIKPTISEGDLLRLEITLNRSDQGSAATLSENQPPPDKTENQIETVVTVPNDSTIILGGINQLDQKKGGNKVPILGDIPLIGGLFRSINNVDNQTKLYIFVKANIMRSSEDVPGLPELEQLSQRKREAFEEEEADWQKYEDWPGIKPDPVDPVKVLDVE